VNYNYMGKYLIEANIRYDGTSKFPDGKRWGLFPSVSAGWNVARESFFKVEKINDLKIRASYGSLGNQQVGNYLFFSKVPIYSNLGWILSGDRPYYIGAPGLVSNNLTWETANTLDFGLDLSALKNRLDFSFDWYSRQTLDMIGPANALPSVLGVSVPRTNNADMVTRGFEASIGWKDRASDDFQYTISFNLSDYVSEITRYNNPNKLLSTYYEGMTLGEIWGYETAGIIQTDEQLANIADQKKFINSNPWKKGDIEYKDLNGDKVISPGKSTLDDPGDRKVIGNSTPRYSFGFIFGCNWKGFDFSMFWQGIMKRDIWLGDIPFFGITGSWTQQVYETTTDYWTPENTDAYFARPYATGEIRKNQQVQTRFLQSAAYTRLKNIQLGYTLPDHILKSLKIQKIRVYLNGENLLTFSPIDENFDPERIGGSWGNGKTYPLFRTLTAGINIEF
jgi:TonB-linked SusC/RagA family outer membrane protein